MKIAFLVTGDEITQGHIVNTNSQYLANTLFSYGIVCGQHLSVADDQQQIANSAQFLLENHDILMTIGGLGPTSDDVTRQAIAAVLNLPLSFNEASWQHILNFYKSIHISPPENNKQQAYFVKGARRLPNPNGTAEGALIKKNKKIIIMLPGPPHECIPMFEKNVLPTLLKQVKKTIAQYQWRVFSIAESLLAEKVEIALKELDVTIGYRAIHPYIDLKISPTNTKYSREDILLKLLPVIAPYIICTPEKTACELLLETLKKQTHPILVIDKASGGHFEKMVHQPDTAHAIHFRAQDKVYHAIVEITGLDSYWQQLPSGGETCLQLTFKTAKEDFSEKHFLPYRQKRICYTAREFIAYRVNTFLERI